MNSIQKLTEYFADFPGIGPRQAKRFVYFLLTKNKAYIDELTRTMNTLGLNVATCSSCFRFFQKNTFSKDTTCDICSNENRQQEASLVIVCRDVDLENIEKAHVHKGVYFVLGGSVPILEKNPEQKIRLKELTSTIIARANNKDSFEIILAMNANPEGEHTTDFVEAMIKNLNIPHIKISHLGRGISTGTELEYSDPDTIKNALKNRS
jgi:recombination protein RecR